MALRWRKRIIVASVLMVVALVLVKWVLPKFIGRPLNSAAWQDPDLVKQGVRLEMADWMILWKTIQGKTKEEVFDLLGEPNTMGIWDTWDTYYLGPERYYFSSESEWLLIRYGPDDLVAQLKIAHGY